MKACRGFQTYKLNNLFKSSFWSQIFNKAISMFPSQAFKLIMSFFSSFFRVVFSTLKISKVILRKDHAMKRHPVHDSFPVQTQLALIAGWECLVAAAATARGKSKARLSQRRLPPTDVPPTTESNPTQRSVDNGEAPLLWRSSADATSMLRMWPEVRPGAGWRRTRGGRSEDKYVTCCKRIS